MQRNPQTFLLLAFLTGPLLLGSCGLVGEKDAAEEPPPDTIHFQATLNGEHWSAEPSASISGENTLVIEGDSSDPQSFWNEVLIFSEPFTGPKTYSLIRGNRPEGRYGGLYVESSGDVLIATYYPTDDSSANQLTITSYDSTTGIMTGRFHTTVVVKENDQDNPRRRRPDRLRFTDGSFKVRVEDRRGQ